MRRLTELRIKAKPNVHTQDKLTLHGMPLIDIRKDSQLYVGNNVTLNSSNRGYHLNMHSPVKLFADAPGAEIRIGDNTRVHGSTIHAKKSIVIGKNCLIAGNCHFIDTNGHELSFTDVETRIHTRDKPKPIVIEDNVWICANCMILPGVTIGYGSVITANSSVVKDIPPMVLAGGNPAKVIRRYQEDEAPADSTGAA